MTFYSILFNHVEDLKKELLEPEVPAFFPDLNLDQIVDAITADREEYNLKPFFYTSVKNKEAITYRHEVMKDVENPVLYKQIKIFARNMRAMRERLTGAGKLYYQYQKERLFLEAIELYCQSINTLAENLSLMDLKSRGFLAFREYLSMYIQSADFISLHEETKNLIADLSTIKYCIHIKGSAITVGYCESEIDYSTEVEQFFEKFKQEPAKDYRIKFSSVLSMNHIEAQILDFVAKLYPDIFRRLDDYCAKNVKYLDKTLVVFDREIQFYVAYLEYIALLKQMELHFCYPLILDKKKEVYNYEGFDLALAHKLMIEKSQIVCNDFYLKDEERIIVVSGPNQGGKTTFARTFGQLHYLTSIGCPVPGREAQLFCMIIFLRILKKKKTSKRYMAN